MALTLTGCSTLPSGPVFERLLDPPADAALVYVARHHNQVGSLVTLDLLLDGQPVARIKDSSFTVLRLPPGTYELRTFRGGLLGEPWDSATTVVVSAGDRQGFFIGLQTRARVGMGISAGTPYSYPEYDVEKRLFERWPDGELEGLMTGLIYLPATNTQYQP